MPLVRAFFRGVTAGCGILLALAALFWMTEARAHSWYPWQCCSGRDCAPVESAKTLPGVGWLMTSQHGTALVPFDFERRESKDGRSHICMRPGPDGQMRPICYFEQPGV